MKTEDQSLEFDFKKLTINNLESKREENLSEVFLETCIKTVMTAFTYIFMTILFFKLTTLDLMPITYLLCKLAITMSAITDMLKYINKKSLKLQIFNGVLYSSMLLYLFKYDGLLSITSFLQNILSSVVI